MTQTTKHRLTQECNLGAKMHELARQLFPICRSISGEGFRQSLQILGQIIGGGGGLTPLKFTPLKVELKFMIGLFHLNGTSKMLTSSRQMVKKSANLKSTIYIF